MSCDKTTVRVLGLGKTRKKAENDGASMDALPVALSSIRESLNIPVHAAQIICRDFQVQGSS